jgi:hypothetical protein
VEGRGVVVAEPTQVDDEAVGITLALVRHVEGALQGVHLHEGGIHMAILDNILT